MTDVLTLVFRTFGSQTDPNAELRVGPGASPPPPPAARSALVLGERGVGRSVLLLAAVTAASRLGLRVAFFTRAQIQSLPLSLQKCCPSPSPESLKKITFSYPGTVDELLQQVAGLHLSPSPPSLIIVDGLEGFLLPPPGGSVRRAEESRAAHLSALLCDTAAFLTRVLERRAPGSGPCRFIASFQSEAGGGGGGGGGEPSATDPVLDVLDRYFQVRCTLDADGGYEAAAAGLQQVWHVYLSGSEDGPGAAREWQLLVFPDGLMEFKLV